MGRAVAEILFGKRNPAVANRHGAKYSRRDACLATVSGENLRHHYGEGLLSAIAITINAFFRRVSRLALA